MGATYPAANRCQYVAWISSAFDATEGLPSTHVTDAAGSLRISMKTYFRITGTEYGWGKRLSAAEAAGCLFSEGPYSRIVCPACMDYGLHNPSSGRQWYVEAATVYGE